MQERRHYYRNEDTAWALLYIEWKHSRNGHTRDCKKEMETISSQNIVEGFRVIDE